MNELRICAVVPTYDNPLTVERVVTEIRRHVSLVIVVDDGSNAPARAVLDRLATQSGVVLVRHGHNQGKGAAVKSGLREAIERGFTHALQVDADGQHDLEDIPRFVAQARDQPEALVLGSPRFDATRPSIRGFGHRLTNFWTNLETSGPVIDDPQCGFRVYPLAAIRRVKVRGTRMDFDPEVAVRLHWMGTPIVNVPTRVRYLLPSEGGVSHFRMGHDNALMTWMHTQLCITALLRWLSRPFRREVHAPGVSPRSWTSLPERGTVLGISAFIWAVGVGGRRLARALLWPVVAYYYATSRRARAASRDFLRRVDQPTSARMVFRHLMRFGQVALDRVLFVQKATRGMECDLGPVELLHELRDSPRGALLLGAHLGSFEAMAGFARERELHVNAVVNTAGSRVFMGVLERIDPALRERLIDLGDDRLAAILEIRARVDRGEHVAVLADRCLPGERSVVVPFMGQDARFPAGPYLLAATLQCPVYFVAALYDGGDRYAIRAERLAERVTLPRSDRDAALREWATRYAQRLEALARDEPLNWFNFYDFWHLGE